MQGRNRRWVRRRTSGRSHYNYWRDYDPATGRYIESDPIGLLGGINLYAYANSSPISLIDPLGLRAWSEQETWQQLQLAYQQATAGRVQGLLNIFNNSKSHGPYDYGWNSPTENDSWTRCGVTMDADHFANYMAGFQGAAYDSYYFWTTGAFFAQTTVKTAGVLYHLDARTKARNDPYDRTGFPMINAGEKDGWNFNPNTNSGCGCKN